jgi:hypothetical protein
MLKNLFLGRLQMPKRMRAPLKTKCHKRCPMSKINNKKRRKKKNLNQMPNSKIQFTTQLSQKFNLFRKKFKLRIQFQKNAKKKFK